ncbi:MAG: hypothetical protein U1E42_00790 [Rhodospirillales bacterium]
MMGGEPQSGDENTGEPEGRYGQALVAVFLLGVVLFHPLVLDVFDLLVSAPGARGPIERPAMLFGMPLLYVYVFFAWALIIALLALVVERASRHPDQRGGTPLEGEIE